MQQIDTNLHKPVIFLNGTKYKLDKAYTFINGEKKILWGESGVQIDYISSTGSLGGGYVFAIGENWVDAYRSSVIYRINISNLSNPTLIQNVTWGNVRDFNGYQTTAGTMMFDTERYSSGNATSNKLQVSTTDGSIVVGGNGTYTGTYLMFTDNNLVTRTARTYYIQQTGQSRTFGTNFYWNGVLKYSTGRTPTSATDVSGDLYLNGSALQVGQDSIIFNLTGNYGSGSGLYLGTDSSYNRVANGIGGTKVYDDDAILNDGSNRVSLLDKTSYAELAYYEANIGDVLKCLGRIGNYYYVLTMPSNLTATSGVKLILLNKSDLSVAFTRDLPSDPFNEYEGKITFWLNIVYTMQISQTGFLGVSTYNTSTLGLRIARFSGIF